jgi:hypothetical protein
MGCIWEEISVVSTRDDRGEVTYRQIWKCMRCEIECLRIITTVKDVKDKFFYRIDNRDRYAPPMTAFEWKDGNPVSLGLGCG